eukprot:TRINITY_DN11637_c0_g1_i1.p1 TRINITY_DN11637_c0_g1~~TRINITY_DN11637_c0_g1_i1.p1  ORF type:complete len:120 (-),score=29.77 TRINITY_DN11637_c0_g1_i1:103-423(-)
MNNSFQLFLKKYNNNQFIFFLPKKLAEIYKPLEGNQSSTLNLQLQSTIVISKSDRDWLNLYDDNTRTKRVLNENLFKEIEEYEEKEKTEKPENPSATTGGTIINPQ